MVEIVETNVWTKTESVVASGEDYKDALENLVSVINEGDDVFVESELKIIDTDNPF